MVDALTRRLLRILFSCVFPLLLPKLARAAYILVDEWPTCSANANFLGASGIAVDGTDVYVLCVDGTVTRFSQSGAVLSVWVNPEASGGITAHDGRIYVIIHPNVVAVYDRLGNQIKQMGAVGVAICGYDGFFAGAQGLGTDSHGNLYVCEAMYSCRTVNKFDSNDAFVENIGYSCPAWSPPDPFCMVSPRFACANSAGDLYVSEGQGVKMYNAARTTVQTIGSTSLLVSGLCMSATDHLFVLSDASVYEFDQANVLVSATQLPGATSSYGLAGIAMDLQGRVYLYDRQAQALRVFEQDVVPVRQTSWSAIKAQYR